MKRPKRIPAAVALSLFAVAYLSGYTPAQPGSGVLDLSSYRIFEEGIIELNGEWLIFWEELLEPAILAEATLPELRSRADGSFKIPRTWNGWEYRGEPVGGLGHATFMVELLLPRQLERAALWIPNASTAYKLWVDGELLAQSGTPGASRAASRPHYVMNSAEFAVGEDPTRIVLQVSNYHHRRGGMWKAIKLGTPEQIALLETHETTYDYLLLGSFLALGLFNLFLYVANRDRRVHPDRSIAVPLLLGIAFIALIFRVLVTGQILTTRIIPSFPWALQLRIEYLSAMVVLVTFAWVADRTYPGVVPRPVIWGITAFVAANASIAIFFPVIVYSRVVTSYNVIKSITLLGMSVRFVTWALKGHREAWAMVGAIVIFFLITFGETLHYREVILSRDFAPVGFIVSLFGNGVANRTLLYLASTLGTLGVMLVVFNLFVLRVSMAFLRSEERLTPLDPKTLRTAYGISPRELEILRLVATGKSNKEIGAELYISEGTVKNHLYRIMRKLDVGNRTEIAVRLTGFATLPDASV
ncbi:MAG: LuxR C-terminal-related transcriptional regulator [Spirochaetaceae bacterium]